MLYVAVTPDRPGHRLSEEAIRAEPNRLAELLPDDARLAGVIRVVDFPRKGDPRSLWLNASCIDQRVLCFLAPATGHSSGGTLAPPSRSSRPPDPPARSGSGSSA